MPASRICPTPQCPAIITAGTQRCPTCARDYEQRRGNSTQRGYDWAHQQQSRALKAAVRRGERVLCWRCGQPITDADGLHLGHVRDERDTSERRAERAAEHLRCNLTAAGKAGAAIRNA